MHKFRVSRLSTKIKKVEITRETKCFVFVKTKSFRGQLFESRVNKDSYYVKYFNSWKKAHEYLVDTCKNSVINLEKKLYKEKMRLDEILNLTEEESGD